MIKIKLQLEKANNMDSKQKIIYTKSCLEFLDYKCVTPDDKDFRVYEGKNSVIPSMVDANFSDGFLNNWNWIMEMVEAIEKKRYEIDIFSNCVEICDTPDENYITESVGKTKKEAVVQAINQFLIWYNNQNL